jgi:hypothetical protein
MRKEGARQLAFEATGKQALVVLVLPVHRNVACSTHDRSSKRVREEGVLDLHKLFGLRDEVERAKHMRTVS